MGTLFVVATPIGNRADFTDRARETLSGCRLIAAEDTRHSGQFLRGLGIGVRLLSLNEHNLSSRLPTILGELGEGDVGLVTDAGTPTISDPGYQLVDAAHRAGFPVRTVPGASAVIAALSVSGYSGTPFAFGGYVPRAKGERERWFDTWLATGATFVCFEAPGRIRSTLETLQDLAPNAAVALCRELTKIHEQTERGTPIELLAAIDHGAISIKGEFVIVIAPVDRDVSQDSDSMLRELMASGLRANDAAREVAARTGLSKSDLYRRILEIAAEP